MEDGVEKDLVSIIVPVYHAKKYIRETMDCIRNQTYENWELLLVEDCGNDGTAEMIMQYRDENEDDRIRLFLQPGNLGAAAARNRALDEARGRFITYIDADDLWEPDKLERECAFLLEKNAAFVFTGYEFADENGVGMGKVVHVPEMLTYRQALKNTTIFTSTVMFDTQKISKQQLVMPSVKSEDTALWWRVLKGGVTAFGLDENLVRYRRGGKSLSSNKIEEIRRIWNLYRKEEKLSVPYSAWNFLFWAFRAVFRRI